MKFVLTAAAAEPCAASAWWAGHIRACHAVCQQGHGHQGSPGTAGRAPKVLPNSSLLLCKFLSYPLLCYIMLMRFLSYSGSFLLFIFDLLSPLNTNTEQERVLYPWSLCNNSLNIIMAFPFRLWAGLKRSLVRRRSHLEMVQVSMTP